MSPASEAANVVLVHDGFVDGSGWLRVSIDVKREGYQVTIVQNPTISLAGDVEVTRRAIAGLQGPVILVGHDTKHSNRDDEGSRSPRPSGP
jgi:hypothetical protein